MKITQAMKMVSAAKFRHASVAIVKMRPYSEALSGILARVGASLEAGEVNSPYTTVRPEKKVLLVAVTSNKGLCGAFNANVVKRVRSLLAGPFASAQVDIATIGSKGRELLSRYCTVSADYSAVYDNLTYAATAQIAQKIMDDFAAGVYDRVEIVYNRFKNAATQVLTREEFLPMTLQTNAETAASHTDFILEPDSRSIVENLLPAVFPYPARQPRLGARCPDDSHEPGFGQRQGTQGATHPPVQQRPPSLHYQPDHRDRQRSGSFGRQVSLSACPSAERPGGGERAEGARGAGKRAGAGEGTEEKRRNRSRKRSKALVGYEVFRCCPVWKRQPGVTEKKRWKKYFVSRRLPRIVR